MIGLALLALLPPAEVIDSVDVIELNHVFCPTTGNETGVYYLYWELRDGEYVVREWRSSINLPRPKDGAQEFWDAKSKVRRRIESKVFIETSTWFDRETENRKVFPESRRRKLHVPSNRN